MMRETIYSFKEAKTTDAMGQTCYRKACLLPCQICFCLYVNVDQCRPPSL